jgi:predicted homoserine dehydrogenase-like protein
VDLSTLLAARTAAGRPVRAGLIGAGKAGTMFLAQARSIAGLHVAAVADIDIEKAHLALALAGWPPGKAVARSLDHALTTGGTWVSEDPAAMLAAGGLDVVVEATGSPAAGARHAMAAFQGGVSVVMASVETDALVGPLLALRAEAAGLVYSLAYGDQPALICELVDWARTSGFQVAAAGMGVKYRPGYNNASPETVWRHFDLTPEQARAAGLNARQFNSALDGTKAALKMAAVVNATGLAAPSSGLAFPPCGSHDLPRIMKPVWDGGRLEAMGQVEAASSQERDGRHVVGDLRQGVFVTFKAPNDYAARCFAEHDLTTDDSGDYAVLWRPRHLAGMELGISVASVACRQAPTGRPATFAADVVAVAKRDLAQGELLDGEGGSTVWGRLLPAAVSLSQGALPIGLSHAARLRRPVSAGQSLTQDDVVLDEDDEVVKLRREMEGEPSLAGRASA